MSESETGNGGTEKPGDNGDNPAEYFNQFKSTPEVQKAIDIRYQRAVAKEPTVTLDEVAESFYGTDDAVKLLWDYYKQHPFELDWTQLSPEFTEKLRDYFVGVLAPSDKSESGVYKNQEDVLRDDVERSRRHTAAAQQLVREHAVPNISIGRKLVHYMAISEGLDAPDPKRDELRRRILR